MYSIALIILNEEYVMSKLETIYGLHSVNAKLSNDAKSVHELYLLEGRKDQRIQQVLNAAKLAGVRVQFCSRQVLDEKVYGENHQGVVAICEPSEVYTEADIPRLLESIKGPALILVLDGVEDPHNLGACIRSADAAGVHFIIAPKDRSSPLTPVARKVASGGAENVPFIMVTNLARTLQLLQEQNCWSVGLAGEADQSIYAMDLKGSTVIVMGAEGEGLRRLTKEHCDYLAYIPMNGSVSSLNVSVATGVALFEAVRQRTPRR
ncbi:MAG: methyltransferase, TrmH family, group 3 [Gammaproteobacteria bacterium]|jgi:23S rRNA (guanosine2251-2'-O)-methyltransferase|nr:methyltransferase, TrmH family, group 3 [Gammaproteobacteria bacterium]